MNRGAGQRQRMATSGTKQSAAAGCQFPRLHGKSPLLGLRTARLAAHENGVRINEPFGDIRQLGSDFSLVDRAPVQLLAGANPAPGLNTLGGAPSLRMKNGFNYQGGGVQPTQQPRSAGLARWRNTER